MSGMSWKILSCDYFVILNLLSSYSWNYDNVFRYFFISALKNDDDDDDDDALSRWRDPHETLCQSHLY